MEKNSCIAIVFLLILCLSSFGSLFAARAQDESGGDLIFGVSRDFSTLNGALITSGPEHLAIGNVFNSLLEHDKAGNPLPGLAESWEISADNLMLTFHLYHNVTWHDGVLFTSADVKFSLEKANMIYNNNAKTNILPLLESIETPDNYTVVFKTKAPAPGYFDFYMGLTGPTCCIIPKHLYENTDITLNTHNSNPIGTGPYKFVEWVKGDHLTLEANDNYFKGRPSIDHLIFRIIPDEITRSNAWAAGEVNYLPMGSTSYALMDLLQRTRPDDIVEFYSSPFGDTISFEFNMRRTPFDNVKVRQAICAAIDKAQLLELVHYGGGTVGTSVISTPDCTSNSWFFNSEAKIPEYNTTRAEQLLDEAGYPKINEERFKTSLWYSTAYAGLDKDAALIKDQLKKVGITVELKVAEDATYQQKVWKDWDFDMCLYHRTTNPPSLQRMRFYSTSQNHLAWSNNMGYNNSLWDQLDDQQTTEMNKTRRAELIKQQQVLLAEDLPCFAAIALREPISRPGNLIAPAAQGDAVWVMMGRFGPYAADVHFESPPVEPSAGTDNTLLYIGAAIAVIIVVPIVAFAFLRSRKKTKP